MSLKTLEDKKDQTLNRIIAHGILKELTELRGLGGHHHKRWGLELLQNALDASKDQGVAVVIRFEDDKLVFSHDGRTFKEEDLIHLIYHGSTKVEAESASGKLGTGFLSTHLLSSRVRVTGTLQNTQEFSFILDRDAQTLEQLTRKMKDAWLELEASIHILNEETEADTTFEYYLADDKAKKICQEGIAILEAITPIILAFDRRLRSMTIIEGNDTLVWNRGESSDSLMPIELRRNGVQTWNQICCTVVVQQGDVAVALPLFLKDDKYSLVDISKVPKLYYPLPLLGTSSLPFPALISSLNFKPTKDREGLLLTDNAEEQVQINKKIIEEAFAIFDIILNHVSERTYGGLYNVARVPNPNSFPNWLSERWIKPFTSSLISKLRDAKLVSIADSFISPKDSHIPIIAEADFRALWELSSLIYPKSTPNEADAKIWQEIIEGWARHLYPSCSDASVLEEGLTIEKLVKTIEGFGDISNLQSVLGKNSASDFINKLVKLILTTNKDELLDISRILPDQTGIFRYKKNLSRDPGIQEATKNALSLLGHDIRKELLSTNITCPVIGFRTEKEALQELAKYLKTTNPKKHKRIKRSSLF